MMSVQQPHTDRASQSQSPPDRLNLLAAKTLTRDPVLADRSIRRGAWVRRTAWPSRGLLLALAGLLLSALWLGGCAASSDDSVADSQTSSAAGSNTSKPNTSKPNTAGPGGVSALAPSAPTTDLPIVRVAQLPAQARQTLALIAAGGPYPYSKDGTTFGNREGILPRQPSGFYAEYTVITPGSPDRGARRIVAGDDGSRFYTDDHYASFREVIS